MQYALAYQLNGTQTAGLDPDAKAYINAVVAAGATVSGAQRTAINNFYKTAKLTTWYSNIKRLYLPVWGVASPNAVDLITTTSGTFVGGITHGSGFIQGNGTSGYFNPNVAIDTLGYTNADNFTGALITSPSSIDARYFGAETGGALILARSLSAAISMQNFGVATNLSFAFANQTGVLYSLRTSQTFVKSALVKSSGETSAQATSSSSGTPAGNCFFLARSVSGVASAFSNASLGLMFQGVGFTTTQATDFVSSVRSLYENVTGITPP
jgi:hypothetical protein